MKLYSYWLTFTESDNSTVVQIIVCVVPDRSTVVQIIVFAESEKATAI